MDEVRAVHARVTGRVQGVWYRASAVEKARELGVCGWVRNMPDGSVELYAEGDTRAVADLIVWCHRGPALAVVDGVETRNAEIEGHKNFGIR